MISLQEFRNELKLMEKQYGQEEELYPYIYMLLREAGFTQEYSVRSVARARRAKSVKGRELLMGYTAFPDIAILDKSFFENEKGEYQPENEIEKLYCCVEAKKIKEKLLNVKGEIQIEHDKKAKIISKTDTVVALCSAKGKATAYGELIGELLWYGHVIYTNGYEWKYLKIENFYETKDNDLSNLRKELYQTCVKNNKNHPWCDKFENKIFEVTETPLINIGENTDEIDWKNFKASLRDIKVRIGKNGK